MNTVKIKGKDYVPVHERIKWLNENYEYNIETDYQYFAERKMWVVKAKLTIHGAERDYTYTGLAQELNLIIIEKLITHQLWRMQKLPQLAEPVQWLILGLTQE